MLAKVFILSILLQGCGYHVAGRGGEFLKGVRSLSVSPFVNQAGRDRASLIFSELEQILTKAFTEELTRISRVEIVGKGEAELRGTIKAYRLIPSSYTSGDVIKEYRLEVVLSIRVLKGGEEIWGGELTDSEEFPASVDPNTFRSKEKEALEKIASRLAKLFKERASEDF